jgi:hypothetical protein
VTRSTIFFSFCKYAYAVLTISAAQAMLAPSRLSCPSHEPLKRPCLRQRRCGDAASWCPKGRPRMREVLCSGLIGDDRAGANNPERREGDPYSTAAARLEVLLQETRCVLGNRLGAWPHQRHADSSPFHAWRGGGVEAREGPNLGMPPVRCTRLEKTRWVRLWGCRLAGPVGGSVKPLGDGGGGAAGLPVAVGPALTFSQEDEGLP